jgi:hypothetical protein
MLKPEPIDALRNPETPKPGWIVRFRPSDRSLDDIYWFQRYAHPGRWFSLDPEPKRYLIGKIIAIKRTEDGFYYRINSGMAGWDVSFEDVGRRVLTAEDY